MLVILVPIKNISSLIALYSASITYGRRTTSTIQYEVVQVTEVVEIAEVTNKEVRDLLTLDLLCRLKKLIRRRAMLFD